MIKPRMERRKAAGFTLVEALVSLLVSTVMLLAVLQLFKSSMNMYSSVGLQADTQQAARVAVNMMAGDIANSGTGYESSGVQLPYDTGTDPVLGLDMSAISYFTRKVGILASSVYDARLYAITPSNSLITLSSSSVATDAITVVYRDYTIPLWEEPLASMSSASATLNSSDTTYNSSVTASNVCLKAGDVVVFSNTNGAAAAIVTSVSGNTFNFASGDALHFNQSSASTGGLATISSSGTYPSTTAYRVMVVTYYVNADTQKLMRKVSGFAPSVLVENVANLQFKYDLRDDDNSSTSVNTDDANSLPNQIRKVTISLELFGDASRNYNKKDAVLSLETSVSIRSLSFIERYSTSS